MSARSSCAASPLCLLVSMVGVALAAPVGAREISQQNGMSSMPGMDMQGMQMPGMQMPSKHKPAPPAGPMPKQMPKPPARKAMAGTASMPNMPVSSMQGGNAPPDARSGDYSDGYRYGAMRGMDMADDAPLAMAMLDQLEYAYGSHGNSVFLDGEAWYGRDFDKIWLKAEGESGRGRLGDLRTEGLWDHAIATHWNTQLGVRHDSGVGPARTWAAAGLQGLAPYWFDTEVTLYVGQDGRAAARLQLEYEGLLTQKWILQPKIELNSYGRDDPQRGTGSGLSDAEFGLRLRYEIRREIAPYVGIVYRQRFGHAANFARAQGEPADDAQIVVGLHAWY